MNKNTRRIKKLIAKTKGTLELLIPPKDYSARTRSSTPMSRSFVDDVMTIRRVQGLAK